MNLLIVIFSGKDYDPFLLAEQQMNDLLSDTSEQSVADSDPSIEQNSRQKSFPLSHSSAFVKYPCQSSPNLSRNVNEKRSPSNVAPRTELDDLASDFSSDSTEMNSLSREVVFLEDEKQSKDSRESPVRELGRRVIIDRSKALGGDGSVEEGSKSGGGKNVAAGSDRARRIAEPKVSPKMIRPVVNRSLSVRASSAAQERGQKNPVPKINPHDETNVLSRKNRNSRNNNNFALNLSSSNLSLSSIISSDVDMKRSNSVFDELMTSFEEDENGSFVPSLRSLLKTDSLSSPVHGRHRNGRISDEELSSPESYKRQDHNKMSGDSAYSR